MRFFNSQSKWAALLSAFFILCSTPVFADHLTVTRYFSGAWAQKDHQSQGIMLHIADQVDESKVGVAHWFTFGDDLNSSWFVALGPVDGHKIHMKLFSASGVGFLEPVAPDSVPVEEIGTLDFSFHNCNQGTVVFDTPLDVIGSGEFEIRRLTSLYHSRCSGGISDDTPSDKRPEKLSVDLLPARDDISGSGKAKFWQRPDRSDFMVSVEGIPDGTYDLMVCTADVGDIEVTDGEGSIAYRSPGIDAKLLLDFMPRDCQIDIVDLIGVALTSGSEVLASQSHGNGGSDGPGNGSGNVRLAVDLTNTGVLADAQGEAEFSISGVNTEFEVEIENVPVGLYSLYVAGVEVAQIEVTGNDSKTKGALKFSLPVKANSLELTFEPRGELIEILQGDAIILESLFPDE